MSNFKIWETNLDVSKILNQVLNNPEDWQAVSKMENIAGDMKPYGFMPLVMALVEEGANPKNCEKQQTTKLFNKYTEIRKWLKSRGISETSRAAFFKLGIGRRVLSHIDDGTYYLTRDRFHLSLQGKYKYTVGDESRIIEPGTFFWFNNKIHHDAEQIGDEERITFVFDVPHSLDHPQNSKYI